MSWYMPGTNSYLVAGPWRNRSELAEVFESRGERHRPALWSAMVEGGEGRYSAVLIDPSEFRSAAGFYRGAGVGLLEEVMVLRTGSLPGPDVPMDLEITPMRTRGLESLIVIDHSAFPWLWRNSREEFQEYLETPDVSVWIGLSGGEPVGYVGVTVLGGWGHVDRLAVRGDHQGNGYGSQLLSWALRNLQQAGARYVQLSTQGSNEPSQQLYTRFGFRQTHGGYKLYGVYL